MREIGDILQASQHPAQDGHDEKQGFAARALL